jgi:hypothetical protein
VKYWQPLLILCFKKQLGAKTKWTNYKIDDLLKEVKIKRNFLSHDKKMVTA